MLKTKYPILLASKSPRRQEILSKAGFSFKVLEQNSDERTPAEMPLTEIPVFVSKAKLYSVEAKVHNNIVICADTVVVLLDGVLTKPEGYADAVKTLKLLSGATHRVLTGVSIGTPEGEYHFVDTTFVTFKELSDWEINFYVKNWQPFDKAGSYGVQEFIGMIGVTNMEGSYFNVMGLPIHKVYEVLQQFIIQE
jgi:septum formation protein